MKILTLNPISTTTVTDNLDVVGASDGASAQSDLTKLVVGSVTNPYGHIDSAHVEDLSRFFAGYTQLGSATFGGVPYAYGKSRYQGLPQYANGESWAFVNDISNFSTGEYAVILEGTNGYTPDLLLANFTVMNETLPITGSGIIPVVASANPSVELLPSLIGGGLNPTISLAAPWENAPLTTAQQIIPDFFTTTNCYSSVPSSPWPGGTNATSNGSNVVSVTDPGGIVPSLPVTGPYVPAGTTITANSNVATLTGVTSSLASSTATPTLTFTVSNYSAGIPFATGDNVFISGATPSVYNSSIDGASVNSASSGSFIVPDLHSYALHSATGNGSQVFFSFYGGSTDNTYAVGQNILVNGTGVTAFNFTTPQPITSYSVSGSLVTVGIASTATGTYVSGGSTPPYITSSCQTWVASNAIATDPNQIVMSQNATGSGAIFFPSNVVTFTNGDAGSLVPGQVITDDSNNYVGIVKSVDSLGYLVTLVSNVSTTLDAGTIFTCSLISNLDSTNSGTLAVDYYDTKGNYLAVTSAKQTVFGAIANLTATGLPATGVSGDGVFITYTVPSPTFVNYEIGQYVTVSGFSPTGYNVAGFITNVTSNTFSLVGTATAAVSGTGTVVANGITYYSYNKGFLIGENVSVTGLSATAFNTSGVITATSNNTFQIASVLTAGTTATGIGTASPPNLYALPTTSTSSVTSASSIANTSVTYTCANSFVAGQVVTVTGFTTTATAYNLTGVAVTSATPTTFTVSNPYVIFSGSASATATATLNPAVYDPNGVLTGYASSAYNGSTFTTNITNPSVAFNIASTGLNGSATATTEIVTGQRVFPVNVYDPELSPSTYSTTSFTSSAAGLLPGMWFGGFINSGATIIPPCLITYVDYANNTITLASAASGNLAVDVSGTATGAPSWMMLATTNTTNSTLYNRLVTGTTGFSLSYSPTSIASTTFTATATLSDIHGLAVGMPVTISGSSNTNHNITAIIQSVAASSFTYNLIVSTAATSTVTGMNASVAMLDRNLSSITNITGVSGITPNSDGSTNVVFTTSSNLLNVGQYVAVSGCYQQAFNTQYAQVVGIGSSGTSFTLNYPATTITCYTVSGSTTVIITNFNNNEVYPGMRLAGTGITPTGTDTNIVSVSGNQMVISQAATATGTTNLFVRVPTTFDASNSPLAQASNTGSILMFNTNNVTDTDYVVGSALVGTATASNSLSVAIPATANGTQFVSVNGQTPYNLVSGDFVYGTGVPMGTQIVAGDYGTGTVTTASATASAGTVTYNGASGFHLFVPGQTVSISGNTGSNTNNTTAYDLTNAYVTATSATSFTVTDPTVTTVTSVAVGGTATATRTLTYTVPAHNFQAGEWVTTTGITSTATANQAVMNATFQIDSVTLTTIVRSGTVALTSTAAGTGGYMTAVIGTVTSGNGGTASSEQVLQLSNNVTAGSTTLNVYTESSINTGWTPSLLSFGILSASANFTGTGSITTFSPLKPTNTTTVNGGNYTLNAATAGASYSNETAFYNSAPAVWANQASLATTNGNNFFANITGVPSFTTPIQITSLRSTPVAQVTQGSTSETVYVSNTTGFTINNRYMIQGFVFYVTGTNALSNTITVSPAFSVPNPFVLNATPYPNGDATRNNIYNYESSTGVGYTYVQKGSFLNSTTFNYSGQGSFFTSSNITRHHNLGMYVGAYPAGNRYFGSYTNIDFEKTYITPPSLGSHVGTTLNQPISAQLDTQFVANPTVTTFSTYTTFGGLITLPNHNFVDLTLGSAGGNSIRANYVVIIGSGTHREAVLISGQYQTTDNSDVTQGNAGPVVWQLAEGQSFQYNHVAGEPVVTPNVNLGQSFILGDVVYTISAVASSSPSVGYATYTTTQAHNLAVGNLISISNFTPTGYNTIGATVRTVPSSTTFSIANATTGSPTVYGSMTSQNVQIVSGLGNLEVGQPIYSLYGNIPTGTTVTSILPNAGSTDAGLVGISQLAINNQQTVASITNAVLGSDNNSVLYTANNNFVTGQVLNVSATAQVSGGSPVPWSANGASVIDATSTSFSTTLPIPSPFSPMNLTQIIPNGRNITITAASYASGSITYHYTLPFPGYNLQIGWYINIVGLSVSSYNGTPKIATVGTGTATGTFTVKSAAQKTTVITGQKGVAHTSNMSAAAYYVSSGTFTVGEIINVSGVTPGLWNGTLTVAATGANYFVVSYPTPASGVGCEAPVTSTTGVAAVTFTSVTGGATAINEPLGTGFLNSHPTNTPVLGGADFGNVSTLGYRSSPSIIGSNPSSPTNATVEAHTTLSQPWLVSGNNGTANISTTLTESASAGSTTLSIAGNDGFPTAYPTLTQSGVAFLPPKLGRLNGSLAAGSIGIPLAVSDSIPNSTPFSVTLGTETIVVGSINNSNGSINLTAYSITGTTASGTATTISGIVASAFSYLASGQRIVGSGIPAGTTISTTTASAGSITISNAATGTFGTFTFTLATSSAHGDLTPVTLKAMPVGLQYTTLEVPYVWLLQDLSIGATYSSVSTTPLACNLAAGTTLYLQSGNYGQVVTLSASAIAGSTSLSVTSFTAQYAYSATTASAGVVTSPGSYLTTGTGAFFTDQQTMVMSQAGNYQKLTVSRAVSQNTQSVSFEAFAPNYAYDSTALVFAPYPVSLDAGETLETVYPVTTPVSQSGDGYSGPFTVTVFSPLIKSHTQGASFQYWAWPASPTIGDVTYRPDLDAFFMYDGLDWRLSRILGIQGVYGMLGATNG
jgi:hypothetical protein